MLLLKSSHVMGNLIKGYPIRTKKVLEMGIISEDAPIFVFFSSFFAVKPFAEVLV